MGTELVGKSKSIEYSTPLNLVNPLIKEFDLKVDVCASKKNFKLPIYWTKEDNALNKSWNDNCWINPPYCRDLSKWIKKAYNETYNKKKLTTKVCLLPVRSNTKWWSEIIQKAEIRFINGEVNFNNEKRGLWLPLCIIIFGKNAKLNQFSVINYRRSNG